MNKPMTNNEMKDWEAKTWDRCQKQAWSEAMTRDDIIRMAREAGFVDESFCRWGAYSDDIERFAALVAAAEREACAITCEQTTAAWTQHLYNEGVMDCVKAIRARGEK